MHSQSKKHEPLFQDHMDAILDDVKVHVKAARERKERWLSNQLQAASMIEMMEIKTSDGTPALLAWSKRIEEKATSLPSGIASHLASLLLKPEIILQLLFEAEIGKYFEETSAWHSRPGETNHRNNF